ncbi:MAG: alpha/beta hydrolase [Streptococcaceae bacterium]|jgi:pimeloyl-ACP methyl ester carboxylesterase|nr:alpha/beta hydrolase [Streptococcaceae bacterium]
MSYFVTNDAVKLSYHTYGAADRPAIVLINGFSGTEITWLLQVERFAAAGYFVVTYDARNHGLSALTEHGLTIHRLAADLRELIEHLGLKNVVLLGHSMGASTIMAYEELFGVANIRAVITEDQAPLFLSAPDWLDGWGSTLSALTEFMDAFPRTHLTKKILSEDLKRQVGKGSMAFDFKANRNLMLNVMVQDWRGVLRRENVAHLFLAGGESPIFPVAHAAAARALQPHPKSQSYVFEGCGHIPHLESPDEFERLVLDFISGT